MSLPTRLSTPGRGRAFPADPRKACLCAVLALVVLAGCGDRKTGTDKKSPDTDSTLEVVSKAKHLSDLIVFERAVQLETSDSSLVGEGVHMILPSDSHLVVADRQSKRILAFAHDGRFRGPLGRRGANFQEYSEPSDVEWGNGRYVVVDGGQNKILVFGPDLRFEREVRLKGKPEFEQFGLGMCSYAPAVARYYFFAQTRQHTPSIVVTDTNFTPLHAFGEGEIAASTGWNWDVSNSYFTDARGNFWATRVWTSDITAYDSAGAVAASIRISREDRRFAFFNEKGMDLGDMNSSMKALATATIVGAFNMADRFVLVHVSHLDFLWRAYSMSGVLVNPELQGKNMKGVQPTGKTAGSEKEECFSPLGCRDGRLYTVRAGTMGDNGEVANPQILVWRLKI